MAARAKMVERDAHGGTFLGRVDVACDGRFGVRTTTGLELDAERALSCLVEPMAGDEVVVAGEGRRWFVLAVTTRPEAGAVALSVPGDLSVRVPNGGFSVAARDAVVLGTSGALRMAARELSVEAAEASFAVRALRHVGESVDAKLAQVRLVARTLDSLADRISQRCQRAFRFVEEMELVRAKRADHAVEETLHLRARDTLITAQKVVKVDAEQIQLG